MLKLLKLAVLLGLVAGFLFLLPFGGRTLFDRWRVASGPGDFAARTWAEMRGAPAAPGGTPAPRKGRTGKAPATSPGGTEPPPADQPLETTTEADRKALDQLLDQHLADKPKR